MIFPPKVHVYTVYQHPEKDEPVFVREAFSLWAFIFLPFWAICHRIWWLLIVTVALNYFSSEAMAMGAGFVQLGWQFFSGLSAADWQGRALLKRGYEMSGIATGHNLLEAQQRYFDKYGVPSVETPAQPQAVAG